MACEDPVLAYYETWADSYDDTGDNNHNDGDGVVNDASLSDSTARDDATHKEQPVEQPQRQDTYICVARVAAAITARLQQRISCNNEWMQGTQKLRVLDLGVGTGLASVALVAALSPLLPAGMVPTDVIELWGADLSPAMLRVCAPKLKFHQLLVADLNTNLYDPVLYPSSPLAHNDQHHLFDVVLSVGTTEFVHDLGAFFRQVAHFLRKDEGIFGGTFPANRVSLYPELTAVDVPTLLNLAKTSGGLTTIQVEQYAGWSVTSPLASTEGTVESSLAPTFTPTPLQARQQETVHYLQLIGASSSSVTFSPSPCL